jgi:hypothetical protein
VWKNLVALLLVGVFAKNFFISASFVFKIIKNIAEYCNQSTPIQRTSLFHVCTNVWVFLKENLF